MKRLGSIKKCLKLGIQDPLRLLSHSILSVCFLFQFCQDCGFGFFRKSVLSQLQIFIFFDNFVLSFLKIFLKQCGTRVNKTETTFFIVYFVCL